MEWGRTGLTLAAKEGRELPELGHVESLKHLTLVASTITVENDGGLAVIVVLVRKRKTGTNGNLSSDDTVSAVEALGEHVHGATLSVGDTLSAAEKLAEDGANGRASHVGETVATVGGNHGVLFGDGILDTDGHGLLASGQVAETPNLLLLV